MLLFFVSCPPTINWVLLMRIGQHTLVLCGISLVVGRLNDLRCVAIMQYVSCAHGLISQTLTHRLKLGNISYFDHGE